MYSVKTNVLLLFIVPRFQFLKRFEGPGLTFVWPAGRQFDLQ